MSYHKQALALVAQMTLEEKALLCSGKNFWYLKGLDRLDLPEVMVTDGPHGLRKQDSNPDEIGLNQSVPAVCFPTASATACSFDPDLMHEIGAAIGEECRQENVAVLLGPGVNIKRSPLCGRNFEYFSEDPLVSGEMAASMIEGVQSQGVGVSLKHFAANNQETRRMTIDSVVDERTLREIYLPAFERAVKKAQPWTVMCSYNRLDGEYASQNKRLLTTILRDEWGFEGLVVSDWGAVDDRVRGVAAGMDLEMPGTGAARPAQIVQAVQSGGLDLAELDRSVVRVVELILKAKDRQDLRYDVAAHHALARRAAAQSAVLLKNKGSLLPGKPTDRAAVIGEFAKQPRYQGAGSSRIAPTSLDSAWEELAKLGLKAEFAAGYHIDSDDPDEALIAEACRIAESKDIVYLFAGLPDSYETEGFDRDSMTMPASHNRLIEAVSRVNPKVVVILHGGAPMELTWADQVPAILLMYLGGEAVGGAAADLLLGKVNPGGHLAESWPLTAADAPSHANFPGYQLTVEYREGLFVGYRYYDTAHKAVRYPFGFGLSYTQFEFSDLKISAGQIQEPETLEVGCTVTNTGSQAGSEVVQLYVACQESVIIRPEQELRGFTRVYLQPGESRQVSFTLGQRDFAYYNVQTADWQVETGRYELRLASSSRDIRLNGAVQVESSAVVPHPDLRSVAPAYYDLSKGIQVPDEQFAALLGRPIPRRARAKGEPHSLNSTIGDVQDRWLGRQLLNTSRKQMEKIAGGNPEMSKMMERVMIEMPLRSMAMMGDLSLPQVEGLVEMLNGHWLKGIRLFRKK
jgi:beta-glucosidase